MEDKARIRAEAQRLQAAFLAAGAVAVEADILLPAAYLVELYGEDLRARAYTTSDPLRGEQVLRPDFTVPVVQMHMAERRAPARYTYAGEVFRRQEIDPSRASEYVQVGYELFHEGAAAEAEAEVFALFSEVLAPLGLKTAMGDIGLIVAAVEGLSTTDQRKSALLRHIWRPRRFRALLERYAEGAPKAVAALAPEAVAEAIAAAGPAIGLRAPEEIAARVERLREDAAAPPIDKGEVSLLLDLLAVKDRAPVALSRLRDLAIDMPAIAGAVEQLDARLTALGRRGVAADGLVFEASYGRTTLEYYDGFVFGFYAESRPDLAPVATGGRYDALTRAIGGAEVPAVGGVIRPGLTLDLGEGA